MMQLQSVDECAMASVADVHRYSWWIPLLGSVLIGVTLSTPVRAIPAPASMTVEIARTVDARDSTRDSTVVLTLDLLTRMTAAWTAIAHDTLAVQDTLGLLPDTGQLTLDLVPLGRKTFLLEELNMVALAAKTPTMVIALTRVGFTVPQWLQDRRALYDAVVTAQVARKDNLTPTPTSAIGRNAVFLAAHPDALEALQGSGFWIPAVRPGMGTDTTVVLTLNMLNQLATFWTRLLAEPSAISDTAVHQYRMRVNMDDAEMEAAVGQTGQAFWDDVDLPKLVRRYPTVAADLQQSGLTVASYENIRKSLDWAWINESTHQIPLVPGTKWYANTQFYARYKPLCWFMKNSAFYLRYW